jgi:serine/threonine protein kinase
VWAFRPSPRAILVASAAPSDADAIMKTCPQCSATYPDDYIVCPKDGTHLTGESLWQADSVIRGKYKLAGKIGEGGMAAVYKAHHLLLDEVRALKVIKPELAHDEQFMRRFKNEAINTRKLQHPNAVRVDDLDIAEDGRPFIAMELVEGESLRQMVFESGPLSISETLHIALQVTDSLQAAHLLGLVHRDIKPDNIVLVARLDSLPLVKVLDYGIASLKEGAPGAAQAGMTLTGTGVVIGTPDYMSPEQAMGKRGDELDGRSDLYSLGVVMYRMLTGELPFKADTTVEMILHHIQTIPQSPQVLKPELGIPASVSAIVMRALEKDREKRFASAAVMAQALRDARGELTMAFRGAPIAAGAMPTGRAPISRSSLPRSASPARSNLPARTNLPVTEMVRPPATPPARVPAMPASIRPAASQAPYKKGFFQRGGVWAAAALAFVILGMVGIQRRKGVQSSPQAVQPNAARTAAPAPALETPTPSRPKPVASVTIASPHKTQALGPRSEQSQEEQIIDRPIGPKPEPTQLPAYPERQYSPRSPEPNSQPRGNHPPSNTGVNRQQIRQLNDRAEQCLRGRQYQQAGRLFMHVLAMEPGNRRAQNGLQKLRAAMQKGQGGRQQ